MNFSFPLRRRDSLPYRRRRGGRMRGDPAILPPMIHLIPRSKVVHYSRRNYRLSRVADGSIDVTDRDRTIFADEDD